MSPRALKAWRATRRYLAGTVLLLALTAAAFWFAPGSFELTSFALSPHAPDWDVLARQSPAVQVHLAAAVAAFALGLVQLAGPKGTVPHRMLGWSWVVLMAAAAISSLFIRQLNHGAFSFIHILTGLTVVSLPMVVHAARRGNVVAHRKHVTGLFFGALVLAGALAFLPGRVMWELFLG